MSIPVATARSSMMLMSANASSSAKTWWSIVIFGQGSAGTSSPIAPMRSRAQVSTTNHASHGPIHSAPPPGG